MSEKFSLFVFPLVPFIFYFLQVGDVKNGSSVQETLSCIAEACGLDWVSLQVIGAAFEQKNPKNQAESLNWLTKAITEFGFK